MFGDGTYSCNGFEGQFAIAVPSHDLVVVRLGKSLDDETEQKNNLVSKLGEAVAELCAQTAPTPAAAPVAGARARL
jgi:hypothetical protein